MNQLDLFDPALNPYPVLDDLPFSDPYVPDSDPAPDAPNVVPPGVLAEARNLILELHTCGPWPDSVGDLYSIAHGWDLHAYTGADKGETWAVLCDRVGGEFYTLEPAQWATL